MSNLVEYSPDFNSLLAKEVQLSKFIWNDKHQYNSYVVDMIPVTVSTKVSRTTYHQFI